MSAISKLIMHNIYLALSLTWNQDFLAFFPVFFTQIFREIFCLSLTIIFVHVFTSSREVSELWRWRCLVFFAKCRVLLIGAVYDTYINLILNLLLYFFPNRIEPFTLGTSLANESYKPWFISHHRIRNLVHN